MLKFLYSNRLLLGVLMGVILIVVGGTYYLEHLENEKALEKERNLRLDYEQWHLPESTKARIGSGAIRTIQYSPDGNLLAVVSDIGVWILDAQTTETQHLLAAHTGVINRISFSADGRTLAVATENGEAQIWDNSTGEHQNTFTKRDYFFGVDNVFLMPDDRTLAVVHSSILDLWDLKTGQRKNTLSAVENVTTDDSNKNSPDLYMNLAGYKNSFSADGKTIASDSGKDTLQFWNIVTRKEIRTLKTESFGQYEELLSFSSDLQTAAIASHRYEYKKHSYSKIWEINLWDVNTQTQKKIFETASFIGIPFLVFSPDGNLVASYVDEAIRIWDVNTGKQKKRLKGNKIPVATVAFSPDNLTLVSSSYDNTLRFWDVSTGKEKKTRTGFGCLFLNVFLSADGQTLMSSGPGSAIRLWNANIGQHEKNFIGHKLNAWDTVLSRDGRRIASSSFLKNTIHLWDTNTDRLSKLKGPRKFVFGIAFSRNSQTLASWGSSGKRKNVIHLYDVETGGIQRTLQLTYEDRFHIPADTYFDKNMFAGIGRFNPRLFVWNLVSDDYKITDIGVKEVIVARFSPDGRVLAIVGKKLPQQKPRMERKIVLHDVKTGDHIRVLTGHKDDIVSLAFSPDGQTLASGSGSIMREKMILLWDIETGSSRTFTDPDWAERQYKSEAKVASSLAFSPDGQTLASGMKLGDILLWETATGAIKKTLRGHNRRVSQMFFSAEGQTLISVSDDGTILIRNLSHP